MSALIKYLLSVTIFWVLLGHAHAQQLKDFNYLRGRAHLESEQYDSALVYFDKALADGAESSGLLLDKGLALFYKSQYAMAIQEFEKVEKANRGRASIWIARSYANLRDTENCLKALETHLSSNYKLPESELLLDPDLMILENDAKYKEFWKVGNWYTGLDQTLAEAEYLMNSKQYPEAVNLLSDGVKKGYRKAPLYAQRAEVYMAVANYKLALDDLNMAIEMDRRNAELLAKHLFHVVLVRVNAVFHQAAWFYVTVKDGHMRALFSQFPRSKQPRWSSPNYCNAISCIHFYCLQNIQIRRLLSNYIFLFDNLQVAIWVL